MLLKSPELDVKLVTVATGDTHYRANLAAKLLHAAGRTSIPVATGPRAHERLGPQSAWVHGFDAGASGIDVRDGAAAEMVEAIMGSDRPVTVIGIGPLGNVAAALEREPRIAGRARFVGMHGSVFKGYGGAGRPAAEYNVVQDVAACRKVFSAPWRSITITPLDTCGTVVLDGARFKRVRASEDPLVQAVMENHETWAFQGGWGLRNDPEVKTSVLFDTVAVYLAIDEALVEIEQLNLEVTDEGFTVPSERGNLVRCATLWTDHAGFMDFLVARLVAR